jgi:hypothetical protein
MKRKLSGEGSSHNKKQKSLPELIIEVDEERGTRKVFYKNVPEHPKTEALGAMIREHCMESKYFTTTVFSSDLEAFEKAKKDGTESKFIDDFVNLHDQDNVKSAGDAYSLILIAAISLRHMETIKYILSKEHGENILTSVDDDAFSPLSRAFYTRDTAILKLISLYMGKNQNTFKKTDLVGEDKQNIIRIVTNPHAFNIGGDSYDLNQVSKEIVKDFIYPLYTKESLKDLTELVGVNQIDDIFLEN